MVNRDTDDFITRVRDHIPLKEGLRRFNRFFLSTSVLVRDHIPLKEGLRHLSSSTILISSLYVRDHIPLKEGLRQELVRVSATLFV